MTPRPTTAAERKPRRIMAVDPGTTQSALLEFIDGQPDYCGIFDNERMLNELGAFVRSCAGWTLQPLLVIENVASYGMPVGEEVFATVRWIGRFEQVWHPRPVRLIPRLDVKLHLCKSPRATDANIRQALLDRFGGKDKAVGRKATPGPLYGIKRDLWSALALAVTAAETGDH